MLQCFTFKLDRLVDVIGFSFILKLGDERFRPQVQLFTGRYVSVRGTGACVWWRGGRGWANGRGDGGRDGEGGGECVTRWVGKLEA